VDSRQSYCKTRSTSYELSSTVGVQDQTNNYIRVYALPVLLTSLFLSLLCVDGMVLLLKLNSCLTFAQIGSRKGTWSPITR
jgi:hypothetical protein